MTVRSALFTTAPCNGCSKAPNFSYINDLVVDRVEEGNNTVTISARSTKKGMTLKLPMIPLIGSGNKIQYLIRADDLTALILVLALAPEPNNYPRTITAANPTPYKMKEILRFIAKSHVRKRLFLSVPSTFIWAGLKLAEALALGIGFRNDSVISLNNQYPNPQFSNTISELVELHNFKEDYHGG
jgi:hypothetical protein